MEVKKFQLYLKKRFILGGSSSLLFLILWYYGDCKMQEIYRIEIARPFEIFELSQWIRTHYNIEKHISFMDYQYTPNNDLGYERLLENRWGGRPTVLKTLRKNIWHYHVFYKPQ